MPACASETCANISLRPVMIVEFTTLMTRLRFIMKRLFTWQWRHVVAESQGQGWGSGWSLRKTSAVASSSAERFSSRRSSLPTCWCLSLPTCWRSYLSTCWRRSTLRYCAMSTAHSPSSTVVGKRWSTKKRCCASATAKSSTDLARPRGHSSEPPSSTRACSGDCASAPQRAAPARGPWTARQPARVVTAEAAGGLGYLPWFCIYVSRAKFLDDSTTPLLEQQSRLTCGNHAWNLPWRQSGAARRQLRHIAAGSRGQGLFCHHA